ncbi:MAG TPA: SPFH domain-containing protein [Planctomycetaceae bacterium]|nr:SPFH domain-containing protein [Planctomycetaceae bacterium]
MFRLVAWVVSGVILFTAFEFVERSAGYVLPRNAALHQFDDSDAPLMALQASNELAPLIAAILVAVWLGIGALLFCRRGICLRRQDVPRAALMLVAALCLTTAGCYRPYQPVQLEVIDTSETAFLLPLMGDLRQQDAFASEEYLQQNLVSTKQVQIPFRWVQTGYYWFGLGATNGKWVPSMRLVKVDRAPVTREWTADAHSGTSSKNEAIWVMTSDSVCFSTGWTCTARIASTEDAVKFLFNYPSGSLAEVMDREIRAKIQTEFGLEVTDRPMDELRMKATPVFKRTTECVEAFFKTRGITITNIGISGGYVYQDAKIQETLNKVFQAQQMKLTAIAETEAQEQSNKAVMLKAEGLADAARAKAEGEAEAIKLVADAKAYEIEKAKENLEAYMALKRIELEKSKLERWDGKFPEYFMGGGHGPEFLLQVPAVTQKQ